jgi:hypothetical protein
MGVNGAALVTISEVPQLVFEFGGVPPVVGIQKGDEVAGCARDAIVASGSGAGVWLAKVTNTGLELLDDIRCRVSRTVVNHYDLRSARSLAQRAFDGVRKQRRRIECRDDH